MRSQNFSRDKPGPVPNYNARQGDVSGFWERHGFIGNFLSGVTTALIGPFAFFFIQSLLRRNQQERETERLKLLIKTNMRSINAEVLTFNASSNDLDRLNSALGRNVPNLHRVLEHMERLDSIGSGEDLTGLYFPDNCGLPSRTR